MRVLLDARMEEGGLGMYAGSLRAGLGSLPEGPEVVSFERGATAVVRAARAPFTPWGRFAAGVAARRSGAGLVHGLHVELPSTTLPAVVSIADVIPLEHPASMPGRVRRTVFARLVSASLRRSRRVIVPSAQTAAALAARGADPRRLVLVPSALRALFRPASAAERERARRRFSGGRPYVAAALTARPHKNAAGLAAAAALVKRSHRVNFLSTGPCIRRAQPHVAFVGTLPDAEVRAFYAGAEVVVVPSLIEGFGLPALEALACGVPVVAGPRLGALPLLRPGVLEVDVSRPAEIAGAVTRLLGDPVLRAELGQAGRVAASGLTEEAMARRTLAVYEEALAAGSASASPSAAAPNP